MTERVFPNEKTDGLSLRDYFAAMAMQGYVSRKPDVMHQILAELENRHPPGYLQIACTLLDMGAESRQEFAQMAMEQRKLAKRDHRIRDFSLVFSQAGFGISFKLLC